MRVLSIIGLIFGILIIVICFAGYVIGYNHYRNEVYSDFGEYGGYVRHFDGRPFFFGGAFGFLLLIGSIIGMAVSKKKPAPVVNIYNPQPQYQQQPQQQNYQQPQYQQNYQQHNQQTNQQLNKQQPQYNQPNPIPQQQPQTTTSQTPVNDITAQLAKLAEMREKGILNDQEFADAKKKLLGNV